MNTTSYIILNTQTLNRDHKINIIYSVSNRENSLSFKMWEHLSHYDRVKSDKWEGEGWWWAGPP